MLLYEHLLGGLAVFTCINWVIIIAAIRTGAMADIRSAKVKDVKPYTSSAVTIVRSLSKATGMSMLR